MTSTRSFLTSLALVCALAVVVVAQDKAKEAPAKKPHASRESAIQRAIAAAKEAAEGADLARATIVGATGGERDSYLILVELPTHDLLIFDGGEDPADDHRVLIEKKNLRTVEEAAFRLR